MKKLVLGICTIVIMTAFLPLRHIKSLKVFSEAPGDKTLNGVDYDSAQIMINNFHTDYPYDKGLKSVSAWFSKQEIQKMQTVLNNQYGTVDGVRFSFGEISKNGSKIQVKILLTTTKQKVPLTPDHTSTHGDYPLQDNSLANELGQSFTNKAFEVLGDGGLLYANKQPAMGNICINQDIHRMNDANTYNWIQKRHNIDDAAIPGRRDVSEYNTESEWFEACFVSSLFDAILNNNNNLDGLRVYLGKGRIEPGTTQERDVVILVPTHTDIDDVDIHKDDFKCLTLIPTNLCPVPTGIKGAKITKMESKKQFNDRYFKLSPYFMDGGYDTGELCPTHCP